MGRRVSGPYRYCTTGIIVLVAVFRAFIIGFTLALRSIGFAVNVGRRRRAALGVREAFVVSLAIVGIELPDAVKNGPKLRLFGHRSAARCETSIVNFAGCHGLFTTGFR